MAVDGDQMVQKRVVFFDIAGTLIDGDPWPFVHRHPDVETARVRLSYARVLPAWLGKKLSLIDDTAFRDRWLHTRARLFAGWPRTKLQALFGHVVNESLAGVYREDVLERLQQHVQDGQHVVLVSGVFQELVEAFAARVGAHAGLGSKLLYRDDVCTGQVDAETCVGPRKLDFIRGYLEANKPGVALADCVAYADSYSDLPMLTTVGHGVATYPDERLRAVAAQHGLEILPGE